MDTSALIDGRILDLVATGFLSGDLLIHTEMLRELQTIADSSDPRRRARGRRGLDAVVELEARRHGRGPSGRGGRRVRRRRPARQDGAGARRVARHHRPQPLEGGRSRRGSGPEAERPRGGVPPARGGRRRDRRAPGQAGARGRPGGRLPRRRDDGRGRSRRERIGSDTPIVVRNVIKTATGRMVFANLQ